MTDIREAGPAEEAAPEPQTSDEPQAEAPPEVAGAGQLNVQMVDLQLNQVNVDVVPGPDGRRLLVIGPVLLRIGLPLEADGARAIARALTGGIEIASGIPARPEVLRV